MKNPILHDVRNSTHFKEKFSDRFKDLHKLEVLTNFDISLILFLGGVINYRVSQKNVNNFNDL